MEAFERRRRPASHEKSRVITLSSRGIGAGRVISTTLLREILLERQNLGQKAGGFAEGDTHPFVAQLVGRIGELKGLVVQRDFMDEGDFGRSSSGSEFLGEFARVEGGLSELLLGPVFLAFARKRASIRGSPEVKPPATLQDLQGQANTGFQGQTPRVLYDGMVGHELPFENGLHWAGEVLKQCRTSRMKPLQVPTDSAV